MRTVIQIPPTSEPVSLSQVKSHVRQMSDVHDDLLNDLIRSARSMTESKLGISCVEQGLIQYRDQFNGRTLRMPRPPLVSVEAINYLDANNQAQVLDPSVYDVNPYSFPGEITLALDQSWPQTYSVPNAVWIEYTAGYGPSRHSLPDNLRIGVVLTVANLYYNPSMEEATEGALKTIFHAFLADHQNWLVDEL